jgi:crotonobetainyl-CoA:carnitine CoA-transferase CaiB-like acyl-CoA transferase
VNSVGEAVRAMEAAQPEGWTETLDGIRLAPDPIRIDGARLPARLPPPLLGEHTETVLAELRDQAGT